MSPPLRLGWRTRPRTRASPPWRAALSDSHLRRVPGRARGRRASRRDPCSERVHRARQGAASKRAEWEQFSFDGVEDRHRVDSYHDPFGNLTVGERARLEGAREHGKLGRTASVSEVLRELMDGRVSELQRRQPEAYRDEFVLGMR